MSFNSPVSAEARLEKLKQQIAFRKKQRQEKLFESSLEGTPTKVDCHTPEQTSKKTPQQNGSMEKSVQMSEQITPKKQKTPKQKSVHVTPTSERVLNDSESTVSSKKIKKKDRKRKRSLSVINTDSEHSLCEKKDDSEISTPDVKKRKKQNQLNEEPASLPQSPSEGDNIGSVSDSSPKKKKKKRKTSDSEAVTSETEGGLISEKLCKKSKNVKNGECVSNKTTVPKKKKKNKKKKKFTVEEMNQLKSSTDSGIENDDNEKEDERKDEEAEENDVEENDPNAVGGFTVLGNFTNRSTKPVKQKLADWLANPTVIDKSVKRKPKAVTEDEDEMKILNDVLRQNLHQNGIHNFFPVQKEFITGILQYLQSDTQDRFRPQDICVSAPTGSGKTLSYVLPLLQYLMDQDRLVRNILAVVLLPVRDLAQQVFNVFNQYCKGTNVKVGLVTGKTPFATEQETLFQKDPRGVYHVHIDILVATPGRLVDHIDHTPGLDLTHLKFLVIDEADRMMEDVNHDWVSAIETAVCTPPPQSCFSLPQSIPDICSIARMERNIPLLHKWLFSATLSCDPEKLQVMKLFNPRLITCGGGSNQHIPKSHQPPKEFPKDEEGEVKGMEENEDGEYVGQYTTPDSLTEYLVQSSAEERPLMLLYFLHKAKFRNVICFTNSVETTRRLYWLVKLFGDLNVKEFSSRLPAEKRKKILRKFSKGKIDMLVCSDIMARGMDVENVKCVISYERPQHLRTYIHRIGRTARAGRAGTAISLLEKKEFFHFKKMMRDAGRWSKIKEMKLKNQVWRSLVERYQEALSQLSEVIKEEKNRPKK